jgi:hypothetical protein
MEILAIGSRMGGPRSVAIRVINSTSRRVSICSRSFEKIIFSNQESSTRVFFASRGSFSIRRLK